VEKMKNWLLTHIIHIAISWIVVGFVLVLIYLFLYGAVNWQVLTGFATWVLAGGIGVAIWQIIVTRENTNQQLAETRKSTNAQIAMDLFKELRDEETIKKLRVIYDSVYDMSKPIDIKDLKGHKKNDIDFVIDRFDVLGVLVDKGIVDDKLADVYAGTPSLRCWYILREYIKEVRKERGYFGDNLEGFARLSLEHFKKTHIKVKFYKKYEEDKGIDLVERLQEKVLQPRCFEKIKKDREEQWEKEKKQSDSSEIYVEIEPELDACVETKAKRQYNQVVSELLDRGEGGELAQRLEILRLFLESADFNRLRSESEKHLVEGKRIKFTVYLEEGKPEHEMEIT